MSCCLITLAVTYFQYELLFCVEDENDLAIMIVQSLLAKYPNTDARLFIGTKHLYNLLITQYIYNILITQYIYNLLITQYIYNLLITQYIYITYSEYVL